MRAAAVFVLFATSLVSGCAGQQPSPSPPEVATSPPVPSAGSVQGRVVDDEARPMGGVRVRTMESDANATTAADGAFVLAGMVPGRYQVRFERAGFEAEGLTVAVRPGESTRVEVRMLPLVFVAPYREGSVFDGLIQAGWFLVNVGDPGAGAEGCSTCAFSFAAREGLAALVLELSAPPTLANPAQPNDYFFELTGVGREGRYVADYWSDGGQRRVLGGWPDAGDAFTLTNGCGLYWPCVDQRFTLYVTAFYHEAPPETFSALPPE